MTSNVLIPDVDTLAYLLFMVLAVGISSLLISRKFNISYVPLFVFFGILLGSVLNLINRDLAHKLFNYIRVFGLVMILFTEGHTLSWRMLKKNIKTIAMFDTLGLLITALVAGFAFSMLFILRSLLAFSLAL